VALIIYCLDCWSQSTYSICYAIDVSGSSFRMQYDCSGSQQQVSYSLTLSYGRAIQQKVHHHTQFCSKYGRITNTADKIENKVIEDSELAITFYWLHRLFFRVNKVPPRNSYSISWIVFRYEASKYQLNFQSEKLNAFNAFYLGLDI